MSQPAVAALAPLPFELVYEDGKPLETNWHVLQIQLATHLIRRAMAERGRRDYFTGGNLFVYYSVEQAREVSQEVRKGKEERAFRGPDVFWVGGVDGRREREIWVAWEEEGRLPDLILELLSPSTAHKDRNEKRKLYEQVFRTPEYFMYDPDDGQFDGLRLSRRGYRPIPPGPEGRLWSEQLGVYLGVWHGVWEEREADWVRLFRPDGSLVPTEVEAERERAEAERERAEAERQRAEAAEAELARLRALLEGRDQIS
jgi:Uma2 family endonuclease